MKKVLFTVLALVVVASTAFAQDNDARAQRERQRAEQSAVKQATAIAKNLKFEGELKDDFVVIYTEYQLALSDARMADMTARMSRRQLNSRTDEDIESDILAGFASERMIIDVREKYYKEFRRILTPTQIQDVYNEENVANGGNGGRGGMMGGPGMMGGMPPMGGPGMGGMRPF